MVGSNRTFLLVVNQIKKLILIFTTVVIYCELIRDYWVKTTYKFDWRIFNKADESDLWIFQFLTC